MGNILTNRMLKLKTRPKGAVSADNFELLEEQVPELKDGQILVKVLYLSFDPTQRGWLNDVKSYVPPVKIGEIMRASSVGQIIESKDNNFSIGDLVMGTFGWQEYAAIDSSFGLLPIQKLPQGIPPTSALSIYGITGLTAFFGMIDIGKPKEGDTVLVSGAAGATGSVAGQIARPERWAKNDKLDAKITTLDLPNYKISLSIKAMEEAIEKEAMEKYGSKDSGASLGAILGKALGRETKD